MFEVRMKNSKVVYMVYQVNRQSNDIIQFLVFDKDEQKWFYILSENCVPV
jgi:hypothetical protein